MRERILITQITNGNCSSENVTTRNKHVTNMILLLTVELTKMQNLLLSRGGRQLIAVLQYLN